MWVVRYDNKQCDGNFMEICLRYFVITISTPEKGYFPRTFPSCNSNGTHEWGKKNPLRIAETLLLRLYILYSEKILTKYTESLGTTLCLRIKDCETLFRFISVRLWLWRANVYFEGLYWQKVQRIFMNRIVSSRYDNFPHTFHSPTIFI